MEFEKLQQIIAETLNISPDEVRNECSFVEDLNADSLDIFQIVMAIEEELGIEISSEEAEQVETVFDAYNLIKQHTNA